MIADQAFLGELIKRTGQKLLPDYSETNSAEYLIQECFYKNGDDIWIINIENKKLEKLFIVLEMVDQFTMTRGSFINDQLLHALEIISMRIAVLGMDKKLLSMVTEFTEYSNPFFILQKEVNQYISESNTLNNSPGKIAESKAQINILVNQCQKFISKAYENISEKGIDYKVHLQLIQLEKLLERKALILEFMESGDSVNNLYKTIDLNKTLLKIFHNKSRIGEFINKSTQIYAREITRNIALKGEDYITSSKEQYWNLFYKALGGGLIVGFACLFKLKMASWDVSLLMKAVTYSLNYSGAFIMIYLLQFSLATKHPAMTAAALAKQLEEDLNTSANYTKLTLTVAKIWRSQFIAFVGNILMVMPIALILIFLWNLTFNENIAATKFEELIQDLNMLETPLIFHAAYAGIFLFISGLIAGSVANKIKTKKIPERIKKHRLLIDILGAKKVNAIAEFVDHYWAGVISNLWFGVFMGSLAVVGDIIGWNLDVRHITFAAGNFMLGLFGSNFNLSNYQIFMSILGVGLIGFINFIVSFSLSLFLALRSRGIRISQLDDVLIAIKNRFFLKPLSFFIPKDKD